MSSETPIFDGLVNRYLVCGFSEGEERDLSKLSPEAREQAEILRASGDAGTLDKENIERALANIQGISQALNQQLALLVWLNHYDRFYDIFYDREQELRQNE